MEWMTLREFLRGGYQRLKGATVVSNHGRPSFTVLPYDRDQPSIPVPDEKNGRKGPSKP